MKLRREQRATLYGGRKRHAVRARGNRQRRIARLRVVRMHEVEVRAGGNPLEQAQIALRFHLVPSHVGNLGSRRETAHRARDDVESLALSKLLALREQELVPETDAEEGTAIVETRADRVEQTERLERRHRIMEGAVTRERHRLRVRDDAWILRNGRAHTETAQGLLDAAEVTPAVVDDRDQRRRPYRLPFVDGTPLTRGFPRVASARARPTALNTASAM